MHSFRFAAFILAITVLPVVAQKPAASASEAKPSSSQPSQLQPQAKQAPGAGPDKVWVNLKTSVYHCPGDRYYGKTRDGQYMTEPDAKKAGAHGSRNQMCFK